MQRILCLAMVFSFLTVFAVSAAEYDRILSEMNAIIEANPSYVQLIDIGKNDQGNTIYGMRIENPNYQEEAKAAHLVVGVHHGNERSTADVAIMFARNLLKIMQDSKHQYYQVLSRCIFYVIPVLNIGGFNANRRTECDKYGNYIDPNRDYPDVCVHNTYYRLSSVQNLVGFIERNNIIGSVTIHGYIGTFTYPWGIFTDNTKTLDHDFYHTVAGKSVKSNNYRIGTHTDVIYAAVGSYEDWAYYKYGIWTTLLEIQHYANIENDSMCVLVFFTQLPTTRSHQHQHTGNCTNTRGYDEEEMPSRP